MHFNQNSVYLSRKNLCKTLATLLLFALLFTVNPAASSAAPQPLRILIDPGHGGLDSGATRGPLKESQIALQVAGLLQKILNADPHFQTSLTRTTDKFLSLKSRVNLIEKSKADLFLSIHANSSTDRRAKGVEFYFQNHLPPDEDTLFLAANENRIENRPENQLEHQALANAEAELEPTKKNDVLSILEDLKRQTRMAASLKLSDKLASSWNRDNSFTQRAENHTIRQAPFYVISKANVPSVLVELGFITNAKDADRLVDPAYQKNIAERIYRGLREYKEMIDKRELGPLKSSP